MLKRAHMRVQNSISAENTTQTCTKLISSENTTQTWEIFNHCQKDPEFLLRKCPGWKLCQGVLERRHSVVL